MHTREQYDGHITIDRGENHTGIGIQRKSENCFEKKILNIEHFNPQYSQANKSRARIRKKKGKEESAIDWLSKH